MADTMKIPVKVYEVGRRPGSKAAFVRDFSIVAPTMERGRLMVGQKIRGEGFDVRVISVSPDPKPDGSILVYVHKGPAYREMAR